MFVGVGMVLHENIIWSSGKNLNLSSPFIIFARTDFGSPWCPVTTIKYFPLSFAILFSFLFTCPLPFSRLTFPFVFFFFFFLSLFLFQNTQPPTPKKNFFPPPSCPETEK